MASAEQKITTAGSNGTTKHSNSNNTALSATNNTTDPTEQPKDAKDLLPHLESLERIIKLPVVNAAWDKSQDVYGKVKGKQTKNEKKSRNSERAKRNPVKSC